MALPKHKIKQKIKNCTFQFAIYKAATNDNKMFF